MKTFEEEIEQCNIIKNNYECDIIVNENKPYTLYNACDIGKILGMSSIRSIIRSFDNNEKINVSKTTKGGSQNVSYITYDGLIKLLLKSRKPESIDLSIMMGLDRKTQFYVSVETDIIKCILTTFYGNNMKPQYKIDNYYIDLYFPDYLLAIECDEFHHNNSKNKIYDDIRSIHITKTLCCKFIRFNPYDIKFNLFTLLNDIHIHLFIYKK